MANTKDLEVVDGDLKSSNGHVPAFDKEATVTALRNDAAVIDKLAREKEAEFHQLTGKASALRDTADYLERQ